MTGPVATEDSVTLLEMKELWCREPFEPVRLTIERTKIVDAIEDPHAQARARPAGETRSLGRRQPTLRRLDLHPAHLVGWLEAEQVGPSRLVAVPVRLVDDGPPSPTKCHAEALLDVPLGMGARTKGLHGSGLSSEGLSRRQSGHVTRLQAKT